MAVVLGVTYPDVYAAIGSAAGGEYAADRVVLGGRDRVSPVDTAELAHAEMGPRARQVPTFIMQGDADTTVEPVFADRLVTHWAAIDDLARDGVLDGDVDDVADSRPLAAVVRPVCSRGQAAGDSRGSGRLPPQPGRGTPPAGFGERAPVTVHLR